MIPKTNLYKTSTVSPAHSRADVEELLEKFGCSNKFMWKRDDPQDSFLAFQRDVDIEGIEKQSLTYKTSIPFIEKEKGNRHHKTVEYDETRSYRMLFHILKHMLLNTDVGMEFEQVFGNYLVVGKLPNGDPMNIQDKIGDALVHGTAPALALQ